MYQIPTVRALNLVSKVKREYHAFFSEPMSDSEALLP